MADEDDESVLQDLYNLQRVFNELRKLPLPTNPKEFLEAVADEVVNPIIGDQFQYDENERRQDRQRLVRLEDVAEELFRQQDVCKDQTIKGKMQVALENVFNIFITVFELGKDFAESIVPLLGIYKKAMSVSEYVGMSAKIEREALRSVKHLRAKALPQRSVKRKSKVVSSRMAT